MRKLCLLAFCLLCLFCLFAGAALAAQDLPALTGRVVDRVGLFSADEKAAMEQALADFEAATTNQFVVAAIDTTGDQAIAVYGTDLFNQWHLGQKGKDNGALLLIALHDRKTWITAGYGIEDRLTDARFGDIYREDIRPFFQQERYFDGVKAALVRLMAFAAPDYQSSLGAVQAPPPPTPVRKDSATSALGIIIFIIFAILGSIGSRGRSRRYWGRRGLSTFGGFWGGGFGGGGFGGGGFGGGGFSGGGGHSGGGGAGGGW